MCQPPVFEMSSVCNQETDPSLAPDFACLSRAGKSEPNQVIPLLSGLNLPEPLQRFANGSRTLHESMTRIRQFRGISHSSCAYGQ